ncbi:MAG: hypothetical protein PUH99_02870 [Firmicutes bacterium]|nr:hypothetical protein [Bacillota bacterium]MDY5530764.1 hypothetical protein [Pumilibacteraceae bacterium]
MYGDKGNILIKDTKILSWGMNSSLEKDDAAIRGDYVVNSNSKKINLENVYFGMDENENGNTAKKLIYVNIGSYKGNTVGTAEGATTPNRSAGTYSYSDQN